MVVDVFFVYSVYGFADSRSRPREKGLTHEVIQAALADSAQHGLPAVIGGDFNLEVADSHVLGRMRALGWHDVAATFNAESTPTCFKGSGSHIDHVFVNHLLVPFVLSLDQGSRVGLADHAPQIVTLSLVASSQPVLRARCYGSMPPLNRHATYLEPLATISPLFDVALANGDLDSAYRLWSVHAELCLRLVLERLGHDAPFVHGRGTVRIDSKQMWPRGVKTSAATLQEQRLWKVVCRLSELVKRPFGHVADKLWMRVCASLPLLQCHPDLHAQASAILGRSVLSVDCAEQLRDLFVRACDIVDRQSTAARLRQWKSRLQSSVASQHAWLRDSAQHSTLTCLKNEHGHHTANLAEQFQLVRAAWQSITEAFKEGEPCHDHFWRNYGPHVVSTPCALPALHSKMLVDVVLHMPDTAAGLDGWALNDLKLLATAQPHVFEHLCALLQVVEQVGRWPNAMIQAYTTLIPKSSTPPEKATDLRPISVLALIYRVWGRLRAKHLAPWQEAWAHPELWGGRAGRGPESLLVGTAFDLEGHDGEIAGLSLDLNKAFDRVPRELLFSLLSRMGLSPLVAGPYIDMLRRCSRRYKISGFLDRPSPLYGGILQGCPLSMMALNAFVSVWLRHLDVEAPLCKVRAYVDDVSMTTCGAQPAELARRLRIALDASLQFTCCMGGLLDLRQGKSFVFGSPRVARHLADKVSYNRTFRLVGGSFTYRSGSGSATPLEQSRLNTWSAVVRRCRYLPVSWHDRCGVLLRTRSSFTWGCATHSLCTTSSHLSELKKLRSMVIRCLLRRDRYVANPTLYLSLLTCPSLNPFFARIFDGLLVVWRVLHASPTLAARLIACHDAPLTSNDGPVHRLRQLDALPEVRGCVRRMFEAYRKRDSSSSWLHVERDLWRAYQWSTVARERHAFAGIEHGIMRKDTLSFLMLLDRASAAVNQHSPEQLEEFRQDASVLRLLLTGGLFTRDIVSRHVSQSECMCDCGVEEPNSVLHVSWNCRHHQILRAPLAPLLPRLARAAPCFRYATLISPPDADLVPHIHEIQRILVAIWRSHIRSYLGHDTPECNPNTAVAAPSAAHCGTQTAPVAGVPSSSSSDPRGVYENGHAIFPAVGGGVFCRKCGKFVTEIRHRLLKISCRKCELADLPSDQWLDTPGYSDNPHRLLQLFELVDSYCGQHDLFWDGSVSRKPPHGQLSCRFCQKSWNWVDRYNMRRSPCSVDKRAQSRRPTPPRWISRRAVREDRFSCVRLLLAITSSVGHTFTQGQTSSSTSSHVVHAPSSSSTCPCPCLVPSVVPPSQSAEPLQVRTDAAADIQGMFQVFDDMG